MGNTIGQAESRAGTVVALTGATGFIGQHIVRELPHRGYSLRVLLRRPVDMPIDCASAVIGDLARPQNLSAALDGVSAVIHSAAPPKEATGVPEDDHRSLDAQATLNLAHAAQRAGVRRFIFMSSIRAQAGPTAREVLTEDLNPAPTESYGMAKLEAERMLSQLEIDWVALRPVLIYGRGMTGNLAMLIRLARSPYPLPLGGLKARRSLLSLENLIDAIDVVLRAPGPLRRPLIVADAEALTVPEIMSAMRRGLGRSPNLISVPAPLLKLGLHAAGRSEWYERLACPLVVDTSALSRVGWTPRVSVEEGLGLLMR